jgi:hypothetical protein
MIRPKRRRLVMMGIIPHSSPVQTGACAFELKKYCRKVRRSYFTTDTPLSIPRDSVSWVGPAQHSRSVVHKRVLRRILLTTSCILSERGRRGRGTRRPLNGCGSGQLGGRVMLPTMLHIDVIERVRYS